MQYRAFGRTGVRVSPFCLGAMNFGKPTPEEEAVIILNRALEAGINFIDTSNSYNNGESEQIIGKALKDNDKRSQVFLATKFFNPTGEGPNDRGHSRYHILQACDGSLRRLQTDHIDLYQFHRPPLDMPQEEALRALDDLVRAGKILYVGSSTFPAWMVMESLAVSDRLNLTHLVSEQPPYNLLDRRIENELIPLCQRYNLAVLPWSPLAGGILAGRYSEVGKTPEGSRGSRGWQQFNERITPTALEVASKVEKMAAERSLTSAQLALLWVKDQPGVTAPIIGPRTLEHLEQFIPVMEMKLSEEDRPLFDALVHPGNAAADFHNSNDWMKARII